jgi:hypothetical protein
MNPHSYAHLIFDKGAKSIRQRKDSLFNNVAGKSGYPSAKKLKLDPCLSSYTSINSKMDQGP